MDNTSSRYWVVPFGNLWIKGHLHLPAAYRSLSRPSSPPRAKASAMRPCLLSSSRSHTYFHMCGMTYTSCCLAFSGNWFILLLVTSCHRALLWSVRNRTAYGAGPKAPLLLCIGKQTSLQYKSRNTMKIRSLQKGGVPAAPSGTATLLRLSPSHQFCPRSPCGHELQAPPAPMA